MTNTEKLYYLFQDINCPNIFMCNAHELQLAEYLVANGVTFATDTNDGGNWTPASDPPKDPEKMVLCSVTGEYGNLRFNKASEIGQYDSEDGWILETWPEWEGVPVTHWMPLPKMPGED